MANPQKENGYTPIANEILEAFIGSKITIPAEVRRIIDFIIRKTYGFNKKEDYISLSQFALATRLKKPSIIRAIKKAIYMNLISRTANETAYKYRFNKDFSTWKSLAPRLIISRTANGVSPTANKSLAPRLPTKDIKDNNTKDISGSDEPRMENSLFFRGKPMEELVYEYIGKRKQPTGIRKDLFRIGRWYDNEARKELVKLGQKAPSELILIEGAGKRVIERIKKFGRDEVVKILQKYLKSTKFVENPQLNAALSADTIKKIEMGTLE